MVKRFIIILALLLPGTTLAAEYIEIVRDVVSNATFRDRVGAAAHHNSVRIQEQEMPDTEDLKLANNVLRMDTASAGRLFLFVVIYAALEDNSSITTEQMLAAPDGAVLNYVSQTWSEMAEGEQ